LLWDVMTVVVADGLAIAITGRISKKSGDRPCTGAVMRGKHRPLPRRARAENEMGEMPASYMGRSSPWACALADMPLACNQ
jgi:hypothetical protein